MAAKKKGLGRGLEALLGLDSGPEKSETESGGELRQIPVGRIQPGRYQPRTGMDPERLQELAEMIGGQRITDTTRAQAKELLDAAVAEFVSKSRPEPAPSTRPGKNGKQPASPVASQPGRRRG